MYSQTGELTYVKVDAENLSLLLKVYQTVWPRKTPDHSISEKPLYPEDNTNVSWLVYRSHELVGIVGVYSYDPDEAGYDDGESIWMDHFAILPEFRRQGLGRQVILDTINYCRQLNRFKYYRLDTVYYDDRPALFLYNDVMELRENYTAEDTPGKNQHYLVYSYSLDGAPMKPWDNHPLSLGNSDDDLIIN